MSAKMKEYIRGGVSFEKGDIIRYTNRDWENFDRVIDYITSDNHIHFLPHEKSRFSNKLSLLSFFEMPAKYSLIKKTPEPAPLISEEKIKSIQSRCEANSLLRTTLLVSEADMTEFSKKQIQAFTWRLRKDRERVLNFGLESNYFRKLVSEIDTALQKCSTALYEKWKVTEKIV